MANPFGVASCPAHCATVSDQLWNDTAAFRGRIWQVKDAGEDLEQAWIQHFGPARQWIQVVFGCHVPIFVSRTGLLNKKTKLSALQTRLGDNWPSDVAESRMPQVTQRTKLCKKLHVRCVVAPRRASTENISTLQATATGVT